MKTKALSMIAAVVLLGSSTVFATDTPAVVDKMKAAVTPAGPALPHGGTGPGLHRPALRYRACPIASGTALLPASYEE